MGQPRMSTRPFPRKRVSRFTYWRYFPPQRIVWDPSPPALELNRQEFHLLLTATREEWNSAVLPVHHLQYDEVENRPLYALTGYVECDKEWTQNPEAQQVRRDLSPQQREEIDRLSRATWPERSKRPERIKGTWHELCRTIARDQETFARFCETPPEPNTLHGTEARIYKNYSHRAITLLGATFIPEKLRGFYRAANLFDESDNPELSTLLDQHGWLRGESIIGANWLDLSPKDRRAAKLRTLHWFHHTLCNLIEYWHRRPPLPWTDECAPSCLAIQQKFLR